MDLKLIMYTSIARALPSATGVPSGLLSIIKECRKNNPVNGVSGALYYSHGRYLQIIEGKSDKINSLINNILKDSRHKQCLVQLDTQIKRRVFPKWQCQLNMSVGRDPYLRQFLSQYSEELRAMDPASKAALNHFIKKKIIRRNKDISVINVDVFGEEEISLTNLPESNTTPLMMDLCRTLANQPSTVDELVSEHGASKRNEILVLLRNLNNRGLLHFGDYNAESKH